MFNQLIQFGFISAMRKYFGPRNAPHRLYPGPIHPDKKKIRQIIIRYSILGALSTVFAIFFIGSVLASILAFASEHDKFGAFVGTAVFWAAMSSAAVSFIALAFSLKSLVQTRVPWEELLVREAAPEPSGLFQRYFQPIVEGISEGLVAEQYENKKVA